MCRVILGTVSAAREYDKRHGLLKLLDHLERQCGGQGNGVSIFDKRGHTGTLKGVHVTIEQCAQVILGASKGERFIFHTRIASVAEVSDERCHPFPIGERGATCMNGTMYSSVKGLADALGITDTEVIVKALAGETPQDFVKGVMATDQVWVGVIDGKEFAVKGDGALTQYKLDNGGYFFCSSLPEDIKKEGREVKLNTGFAWFDGEVLDAGRSYAYTVYGAGGWHGTRYDYATGTYQHTPTASGMLAGGTEYGDDEYHEYWGDKYVKDSSTSDIPAWYGDKVAAEDDAVIEEGPEIPEWVTNEDDWLDGYNSGREAVIDDLVDSDAWCDYPAIEKAINEAFEEGWDMGFDEAIRPKRKKSTPIKVV